MVHPDSVVRYYNSRIIYIWNVVVVGICSPLSPKIAVHIRGQELLTGKLEIQVEILNRWRYAAKPGGCWMTHRDTRHQIDGNELRRALAISRCSV